MQEHGPAFPRPWPQAPSPHPSNTGSNGSQQLSAETLTGECPSLKTVPWPKIMSPLQTACTKEWLKWGYRGLVPSSQCWRLWKAIQLQSNPWGSAESGGDRAVVLFLCPVLSSLLHTGAGPRATYEQAIACASPSCRCSCWDRRECV